MKTAHTNSPPQRPQDVRPALGQPAIECRTAPHSGRLETLLVVEDESMVRLPLCRELRNRGYCVLEAQDGEHALQVMHEHHAPVHLVVTDLRMPRMDGAELVGLLRSWYPALRVLFITGASGDYLDARVIPGWSEPLLVKPFTNAEVADKVRAVLDAPSEMR